MKLHFHSYGSYQLFKRLVFTSQWKLSLHVFSVLSHFPNSFFSIDSCILFTSQEDYNNIVGRWKSKLVRSSTGEQRLGLFIAKKKN